MDEVLKIKTFGSACRNNAKIKTRQPIGKMYVSAEKELPEYYREVLLEELNVKEMEYTDDVSAYTTYKFKPQLRTVGPKYGKFLGQIQKVLSELDGNKAYRELKENGVLKLPEVDASIELAEEDLLIESIQSEGFAAAGDDHVTVVLSCELTPELISEGYMRELVSKIQTMRRDAGFEVMDRIKVTWQGTEVLRGVFEEYGESIRKDVLADSIDETTPKGFEKKWDINGQDIVLAVEKVS
jgi:isoleucyl-tRNA synthetase